MKKVIIRKASVVKAIKAVLPDAREAGCDRDFEMGTRYVEIVNTGERGEMVLEGVKNFCKEKCIALTIKHWGYGGYGVYLDQEPAPAQDYCDKSNPIHY